MRTQFVYRSVLLRELVLRHAYLFDMATGRLDERGTADDGLKMLSAGHSSRYLRHPTDFTGMRRNEVLKASPRMYDSKLLDSGSRVHPAVPPILFVPTILVLLVYGFVKHAGVASIGWVLGGYLFWTLTEYWLHRILFHFEPDNRFGARLHWMMHGVHHDHPNDPMRLVMAPSVSVPLAVVFITAFYVVIGTPGFLPFSAGFVAGYLFYDMLHFYLHHHRPSTRLGRRLRELHMRHHFQDHERGYGVSAPFWDVVFGTFPKKGSS